MSTESDEYGEELGEQTPKIAAIPGEGWTPPALPSTPVVTEQIIVDKKLTFEEASKSLNTLGKDESGVRYAYLMISATNKNLTDVSVILKFKHILFIDLTGNYLDLDSLQVLTEMPYLIYLKADKNRVKSAALKRVPYLQVLLLGGNSIFDTSDIAQPILNTLDLNNNQIYKAEFDHLLLTELKVLDMHGNQLEDISGTFPTSLECLYLAENNIRKIHESDISLLRNLTTLHLRSNKIRKLNGFTEHLENLSYLNLRNNKIRLFRQFRKLQCLPKLSTLIVLENPCAGELMTETKGEDSPLPDEDFDEEEPEPKDPCILPLLVLLPKLTRINKHLVATDDRDEANDVKDKKLQQIMAEESSDEEEGAGTSEYTDGTGVHSSVAGEQEETEDEDEDESEDEEDDY